MGSTATAFIDIVGTPMFLAKTGSSLTLGTQGPQSLYLMTNNAVVKEIDSNGYQLDSLSISAALTATGTNQATGLQLVKEQNVFGTVAASTAAVLPVGKPGMKVIVHNRGTNALLVFPEIGGNIDAAGANASKSLAAGKTAIFMCNALLTWNTMVGA